MTIIRFRWFFLSFIVVALIPSAGTDRLGVVFTHRGLMVNSRNMPMDFLGDFNGLEVLPAWTCHNDVTRSPRQCPTDVTIIEREKCPLSPEIFGKSPSFPETLEFLYATSIGDISIAFYF